MKARPTPWRELLADPGPDAHVVQLYQDADFFAEAIGHFAAEGLFRGESIIVVATGPNWAHISGRLRSKGFAPDELFRRGQLVLIDAEATLAELLVGDMPNADRFKAFAHATIERARAFGKFPRVRWWGEMVNLLYIAGNQRGSTRLDELFDELRYDHAISIFHSFLMDKYDPGIYDRAFGDVCRTHAHVVPTDDYAMHRKVVDRAIGEVIGPIEGAILESLVCWAHRAGSGMPASQDVLLWVKDTLPAKFDEVLVRARKYESETLSVQPS